MRRLTLTLPAALLLAVPLLGQESAQDPIPWANKVFTGTAEAPPPVLLHDFKTLPKGAVRTYRYKMTNIYAFPLVVRLPQVSCGCVSVIEYTGQMGPRETGHIDFRIDTAKVTGEKVVDIFVRFDATDPRTREPYYSTAKLRLRVDSRPDIAIDPGVVEFGVVPAGRAANQAVNLVYSGRQPQWKVTDLEYKTDLLDVKVNRVQAGRGQTAYQVLATLKATAPAGALHETIVLKTNDPAAPALTLAVTGTVQAPLSLRGPDQHGVLRLEKVEIGKKTERNMYVLSEKPFKIAKVDGQGDGVKVFVAPHEKNKVQTLTISFTPDKVGPVKKVLTIRTDTGESVSMTVDAVGVDPP